MFTPNDHGRVSEEKEATHQLRKASEENVCFETWKFENTAEKRKKLCACVRRCWYGANSHANTGKKKSIMKRMRWSLARYYVNISPVWCSLTQPFVIVALSRSLQLSFVLCFLRPLILYLSCSFLKSWKTWQYRAINILLASSNRNNKITNKEWKYRGKKHTRTTI